MYRDCSATVLDVLMDAGGFGHGGNIERGVLKYIPDISVGLINPLHVAECELHRSQSAIRQRLLNVVNGSFFELEAMAQGHWELAAVCQ